MDRVGRKWASAVLSILAPATVTKKVGGDGTTAFSLTGCAYLVVQAIFVVGSFAGATVDAFIQTSLDGGATWIDIMNFHFTTTSATKLSGVVGTVAVAAAVVPGDGALAANSILNGVLGDLFQLKVVSTGNYGVGTTLAVNAYMKAGV